MATFIFVFACLVFAPGLVNSNASAVSTSNTFVLDILLSVNTCVQIVIDSPDATTSNMDHVKEIFTHQYVVRNIEDLLAQDVAQQDEHNLTRKYEALGECRIICILAKWTELFVDLSATNYTRFRPHSPIVIFADTLPQWTAELRNFIKRKSLHVCWLFGHKVYRVGVHALVSTRPANILTFLRIDPAVERSASEQKDVFTVSMFKCEPYTMIWTDEHNRTQMDGIEMRFLQLLQPIFTLHYDIGVIPNDEWDMFALDQVMLKNADMAMCTPWLTYQGNVDFDLSDVVDYQCGTFLVPKPQPISSAIYVYYPLSHAVWALGLISFFLIAALINGFSSRLIHIAPEIPALYANCGRTVLDLLGVLTSQGLISLRRRHLATIRVLMAVWLYGAMLLGIGYSTGYTSLLSSPVYTKTADNIAEYNNLDFVWSYTGNVSTFDELKTADKPFRRLLERIEHESEEVQATRIEAGDRRVTVYTEILYDRYVTYSKHLLTRKIRSLRLMKSCWYSHYTTFAMQKYSPYKVVVNDLIAR